MQWANAPLRIKKITNPANAIKTIVYIENPKQAYIYEKKKEELFKEFKFNKSGKITELLLFHGTTKANVQSILKHNFILDDPPQEDNTKKIQMVFGKGIYFSELPGVSLMYGDHILLCKVLPGKCEQYTPNGLPPSEIPEGYDSRAVKSSDNIGVINVIKNTDQILPYCIIVPKKDSISPDYAFLNKQHSLAISTLQPDHQKGAMDNKHSATSQSSQKNQLDKNNEKNATHSTMQKISPQKTHTTLPMNIGTINDKEVQKCISNICTSPRNPNLNSNTTCPICQENLQNFGISYMNKCKHYAHTKCLEDMIGRQASSDYLVCPICAKIYGTRIGNMPDTVTMTAWEDNNFHADGHPNEGLIIISYNAQDGIQGRGHPNPGKPFKALGFPRYAFLPGSTEGKKVLKLLQVAFERRLTFSVGNSLSNPTEGDCIVWGGIHHKTSMVSGSIHGYPDAGYLKRVTTELLSLGV